MKIFNKKQCGETPVLQIKGRFLAVIYTAAKEARQLRAGTALPRYQGWFPVPTPGSSQLYLQFQGIQCLLASVAPAHKRHTHAHTQTHMHT